MNINKVASSSFLVYSAVLPQCPKANSRTSSFKPKSTLKITRRFIPGRLVSDKPHTQSVGSSATNSLCDFFFFFFLVNWKIPECLHFLKSFIFFSFKREGKGEREREREGKKPYSCERETLISCLLRMPKPGSFWLQDNAPTNWTTPAMAECLLLK